jgi:DNA-binding IclR family transcriptional regulator
MSGGRDGGVGSGDGVLVRALRILRAFDEGEEQHTATGLAARTGLARSTAHRLAGELAGLGLLDKRADGSYTIGTGLWELGELAPVSLRLRERALPHLAHLYEVSGENVHLAVLSTGDAALAEALFVGRVTGPHSIPTLSRMGGRHPLHTTGVGKALLAFQDERFLGEFFARPLATPTRHSLGTEAAIRAEIETTRQTGYSSTRQEMTLGNAALAVPIFVGDGPPFASVSLVTHLARADVRRNVPLLKSAAGEIGDALRMSLAGGLKWRGAFR